MLPCIIAEVLLSPATYGCPDVFHFGRDFMGKVGPHRLFLDDVLALHIMALIVHNPSMS